jgi:hypothetical protein
MLAGMLLQSWLAAAKEAECDAECEARLPAVQQMIVRGQLSRLRL